jgi:hypothetical protein
MNKMITIRNNKRLRLKPAVMWNRSAITVIMFCCLAVAAMSCTKDWLDKQPTGDMTLEEVFSNPIYAQGFLSNIYDALPVESDMSDLYFWGDPNWYCGNPFTGGCDEMEIAFGGAYSHQINSGSWNATTIFDLWNHHYRAIRKCNVFIERVGDVPPNGDITSGVIDAWLGEAYFLRAFNHFWLMRCYGPVVLLDHTVGTEEYFDRYTRRPIDECAAFIAADCDSAVRHLAATHVPAQYGRATSVAALALKARTLLYAASPLYNGNSDYANLRNADGTQLIPQNYDAAKWQAAADAALAAITAAESVGYVLYHAPGGNPYDNYSGIWNDRIDNANKEWLFWRQCGIFVHPDQCADPVSFRSSASIINPTQEIVDAYQMANGKSPIVGYNANGNPIIDPASGYSETGFVAAASPDGYYPAGVQNMYVGREPRFYASINFNLQEWKESRLQFYYNGKDGKSHAGTDYCKTGYLLRKIVDATYRSTPPIQARPHVWVYFRVGELYLNYAEALNEAQGAVGDVYAKVNAIRSRAGLPDLQAGMSKDDMRAAIHHERRIELAFETHRFFDVRRWKEATSANPNDFGKQDQPIHSMNIFAGSNTTDAAYYKRTKVEDRIFEDQHYLFPVPQDEINKNLENIVQNPGW